MQGSNNTRDHILKYRNIKFRASRAVVLFTGIFCRRDLSSTYSLKKNLRIEQLIRIIFHANGSLSTIVESRFVCNGEYFFSRNSFENPAFIRANYTHVRLTKAAKSMHIPLSEIPVFFIAIFRDVSLFQRNLISVNKILSQHKESTRPLRKPLCSVRGISERRGFPAIQK